MCVCVCVCVYVCVCVCGVCGVCVYGRMCYAFCSKGSKVTAVSGLLQADAVRVEELCC